MADQTYAGLTLDELRALKLPAAVMHSEESVTGAVLEPDVPWYEHLERLEGLQQIVRALPELLDEIERLNREVVKSGTPDAAVPAPHLNGARVGSGA